MSATEDDFNDGDLVVIDGKDGVFRVESVFDDDSVRAFSYVDGKFVVVDVGLVKRCPPGTRAAP